MTNERKTIEALLPMVLAIGNHIAEWHIHPRNGDHKQFGDPAHGGWDGHTIVAADFAAPGCIEYRLQGGADIRITNLDIAGVRPEDVHVGPIEPAGPQRVVRAAVVGNSNNALTDVPWNLKYRDLQAETHASTVAKEVGASISAGLRQQVGYGSEAYGIQGETELTLNIEASVKAAWEDAMTAHREHEVESTRDILIRAMHRAVLERVETIGPARQVIRAKGALSFGIRLHAPGHWMFDWDSMADFVASLQGIETKSGDQWRWLYHAHPVPSSKLDVFRQTVFAQIEKVREFEEASNVDVVIRSEPLNDQERYRDALRLIVLQSENAKLTHLAQAELDAA
ncbi:MAG: hypothetical protein OXC14_00990 [Rhodospirillaceae bacterium]|nr:hypothetical protein [Rhodospirillaceae bacterium]